MPTPVEIAVDTFIRAWSEPDPPTRAAMLDACFAEDARFVTRHRELRGRAEMAAAMTSVVEDPQMQRIRLTSVVDAIGSTFRYRAVADRPDGTTTLRRGRDRRRWAYQAGAYVHGAACRC